MYLDAVHECGGKVCVCPQFSADPSVERGECELGQKV